MENVSQPVTETPTLERPSIRISVRNLVEFVLRSGNIDNRHKASADAAAMQEGSKIHRMIQRRMGADYHAEYFLRHILPQEDYDIVVEGRADGIIFEEKKEEKPVIIDEIKSTFSDMEHLKAPSEVHLAQAKCYAYIFAEQNHLHEIGVRMTYCNIDTQELKYFHETYTFVEIRNWFQSVMDAYAKWADFEFHWKQERNASIKMIQFPFSYRAGQKELVAQVYRTIYHKKKLFIEAPTGVGKTVSTVFPAVKAVGEGLGDKIFYLTAKTITRTVAKDCFDILRKDGLRMKTVVITAREKICPLEEPDCNPVTCPYANGHYDRINDAIYDLLMHEDSFSRENIEEYALKHEVCPFEMGLDMSLFSDAVICDYNYVFDPNVYLRRFFAEGVTGSYLFLIDEAHNLVDRAMDMYSAVLYKESFMELKRLMKPYDKKLENALEGCNKQLLMLKRECETVQVEESIASFVMSLVRVMGQMEKYMEEQDNPPEREQVFDLYLQVRHFLNMYDNMGESDYVTYSEHEEDGRFKLKLLCVNPSESIRKCLDKGKSTIFFSATLLPIQYYKDMLSGDSEDYAVYAQSVFDEKKRGLFFANDVSSKYTRRNDVEYYNIAAYISKVTKQLTGNYLVFFPSHAFLNRVYEAFTEYFQEENVECIVQKGSMSETEREEFLMRFEGNTELNLDSIIQMPVEFETEKTLIGFCVMGGIFSEGIDLKHDSLIGTLIVGTGLPMVCNERELLKACYDEQELNGFDYAYRFPGMNKVLQAAGRVIRTAEDIGIVVLLDERFLTNSYKKMFPREWKHFEVCSLENIEDKVSEFWELHNPQE